MGSIGKSFALMLILIMAVSSLSLLMIKPACAQTIPTPSIPEFTVQYVYNTYYVAPSYTINPYTGQNQTTNSGYQSGNETVIFTIKNQPFTPYTDSNGNYTDFYFNFRYKGHFESQWTYLPFNPDDVSAFASGGWVVGPFSWYKQTNSAYTTIVFGLYEFANEPPSPGTPQLPNGSQLDFQVQAMIGQIGIAYAQSPSLGSYHKFTGQSSDWSNTQTLTINYGSNSSATIISPNPTQSSSSTLSPTSTPTVPEFPTWTILLFLTVMIVLAGLTVYLKKYTQGKLVRHA